MTENSTSDEPHLTILYNRRRFDAFCRPMHLLACIIGLGISIAIDDYSLLVLPVGVALLWLSLRSLIPKFDTPTECLSWRPGFILLLGWLALMALIITGVFIVDLTYCGRSFFEPLGAHGFALYLPMIIILIVGVGVIDSFYRSRKEETNGGGEKKERD